jgi:hypothetical protein
MSTPFSVPLLPLPHSITSLRSLCSLWLKLRLPCLTIFLPPNPPLTPGPNFSISNWILVLLWILDLGSWCFRPPPVFPQNRLPIPSTGLSLWFGSRPATPPCRAPCWDFGKRERPWAGAAVGTAADRPCGVVRACPLARCTPSSAFEQIPCCRAPGPVLCWHGKK